VYEKYLLGTISYEQFVVALRVFEELGFIKIVDKFTVEFNSNVKAPLDNSKIYQLFAN
jgi:ssDNA-specific exonuclease RecJ